jgi:APA family basic amino acid/polyamine antiporter
LNVIGLVGCALLVVTLPVEAVLAGVAMFAIGVIGRFVATMAR